MILELYKENLDKLDRKQLYEVIDNFSSILFDIGETLVDVSKKHITDYEAIDEIDEAFNDKYSLSDSHLLDLIDYRTGKISREEYRRRVLGGD